MDSIKIWECKKCGHKWVNRKPVKPIQCPKCRTYLWDREPIVVKDEGGHDG